MLTTFSEFKITTTSPILLTVLRNGCAPWIRRRMKQEQEIQNLLNFMKGNFSLKYNTILFRILFFSKCYHYGVLGSDVIQSGGLVQRVDIQGVSIPMSQTSPVYSPPQNKQKSSYQYGSKNEQFPRYPVLCRNPRIAIKTAELPFHIRCDSHVTAVASCTQVFIVHA